MAEGRLRAPERGLHGGAEGIKTVSSRDGMDWPAVIRPERRVVPACIRVAWVSVADQQAAAIPPRERPSTLSVALHALGAHRLPWGCDASIAGRAAPSGGPEWVS